MKVTLVAEAAEALAGRLAEAGRALGGANRRLRGDTEGLADRGLVVVGGEHAVGGEAHALRDRLEVGPAVVDAHEEDDVLLGREHPADHVGDLVGALAGGVVVSVGDDQGDGAAGHALVLELLGLGHDGPQGLESGVAERRAPTIGLVGRGVESHGATERREALLDAVDDEGGEHHDVVDLLGPLDRVEHQLVAFDHNIGVVHVAAGLLVVGLADRTGVVDDEGQEDDFARLDVVDGDAEAGLDLLPHVGDLEGHHRSRSDDAVIDGALQEEVEIRVFAGHGCLLDG